MISARVHRTVAGETDGLLRRSTIHDMLRRRAARHPHHAAVIERTDGGDRREFSYRDLDRAANRVATRWIAEGVTPGAVIAASDTSSIEYVVAYYAALRCGAAFTGFNPTSTQAELDFLLGHARPTKILVGPEPADSLREVAIEPLRDLLTSSIVDADEPLVEVTEDDIALLVYTSGTESQPKGVLVTHRAFTLATTFSWVLEGYLRSWDRFLVLAPMHTMAGLGTLTNILTTGATVVYSASAAPDQVLRCIHEEGVTNMSQTPAFYRRLVSVPTFDGRQLASLQQCHTYGGLAQASVFEAISSVVPQMVWATYWGQTELSQLGSIGYFRTVADVPSGDVRWIGRATPHLDIRVVDEDDRDTRVGELIVRSPAIMAGYLDDPGGTAAVLRDGWLRTADIVEIDEHQNLFFHDRRKDMIKSGGMNVSTLEVEQVLSLHPAVAEVAVVGLPDDEWSEAVTAFVVVVPGFDVDADELRRHCRGELSGYKVPKSVRFVPALPRDTQGKVRKRDLRARHAR